MLSAYDHEARHFILDAGPIGEVDFENSEELVNDVAGALAWIDSFPVTYENWN